MAKKDQPQDGAPPSPSPQKIPDISPPPPPPTPSSAAPVSGPVPSFPLTTPLGGPPVAGTSPQVGPAPVGGNPPPESHAPVGGSGHASSSPATASTGTRKKPGRKQAILACRTHGLRDPPARGRHRALTQPASSSEEDEESGSPQHSNKSGGGGWAKIREEAIKDGNLELARDLGSFAAPVILWRGREPKWEQIPYAEVKELRKAAKDYGRNSPFFKNVLDLTFAGRFLVPHDLRYIAKALFAPTECDLWEIHWKKLLKPLLRKYDLAEVVGEGDEAMEALAGEGEFSSPEDQILLAQELLQDIAAAGKEALLKIPDATRVPASGKLAAKREEGPRDDTKWPFSASQPPDHQGGRVAARPSPAVQRSHEDGLRLFRRTGTLNQGNHQVLRSSVTISLQDEDLTRIPAGFLGPLHDCRDTTVLILEDSFNTPNEITILPEVVCFPPGEEITVSVICNHPPFTLRKGDPFALLYVLDTHDDPDTERHVFFTQNVCKERPLIDAKLSFQGKSVQMRLMADTGADVTIIPQTFVAQILSPVRRLFPEAIILHDMDDVLVCASDSTYLKATLDKTIKAIKAAGLQIAEEKIQFSAPWRYLGFLITGRTVTPQTLTINKDPKTLRDLQQLCGTITWIRPLLGLTTEELSPLFCLLRGDGDLASPRELTPAAREALQRVAVALKSRQAHRVVRTLPVNFAVLGKCPHLHGLLFQWDNRASDPLVILEWLFLPHQPSRTITTPAELLATLIMKARHRL
ncbi:uncharacterized protein LOC128786615 isoform X2 [Vidua chalybeata]|uniref:uncharacterized protein LOC128786615 isoform X2 n=1 Tax=Vidua chalybeata TaxID=81927 RepID=UPI0023A7E8BF|nr:uncharacterized protein LOC128786615 isoform X2 [Vidua chalybeata]